MLLQKNYKKVMLLIIFTLLGINFGTLLKKFHSGYSFFLKLSFKIGEIYISSYFLQWYDNWKDDCYLADSHNHDRDSGSSNGDNLVYNCSSLSCDSSKTPSRGGRFSSQYSINEHYWWDIDLDSFTCFLPVFQFSSSRLNGCPFFHILFIVP